MAITILTTHHSVGLVHPHAGMNAHHGQGGVLTNTGIYGGL
jgi:hypothetical protein